MFLRQFMMTVSDPSSLNAINSPFRAIGRNVVAMLQTGRNDGSAPSPRKIDKISILCVPLQCASANRHETYLDPTDKPSVLHRDSEGALRHWVTVRNEPREDRVLRAPFRDLPRLQQAAADIPAGDHRPDALVDRQDVSTAVTRQESKVGNPGTGACLELDFMG